jgi:hypothetical protein
VKRLSARWRDTCVLPHMIKTQRPMLVALALTTGACGLDLNLGDLTEAGGPPQVDGGTALADASSLPGRGAGGDAQASLAPSDSGSDGKVPDDGALGNAAPPGDGSAPGLDASSPATAGQISFETGVLPSPGNSANEGLALAPGVSATVTAQSAFTGRYGLEIRSVELNTGNLNPEFGCTLAVMNLPLPAGLVVTQGKSVFVHMRLSRGILSIAGASTSSALVPGRIAPPVSTGTFRGLYRLFFFGSSIADWNPLFVRSELRDGWLKIARPITVEDLTAPVTHVRLQLVLAAGPNGRCPAQTTYVDDIGIL